MLEEAHRRHLHQVINDNIISKKHHHELHDMMYSEKHNIIPMVQYNTMQYNSYGIFAKET